MSTLFSIYRKSFFSVYSSLYLLNKTIFGNCKKTFRFPQQSGTALRNHNGTVFGEMASWTARTRYIEMQTAF